MPPHSLLPGNIELSKRCNKEQHVQKSTTSFTQTATQNVSCLEQRFDQRFSSPLHDRRSNSRLAQTLKAVKKKSAKKGIVGMLMVSVLLYYFLLQILALNVSLPMTHMLALQTGEKSVGISTGLHTGRTLRDALQRILSRHITSSNVLVVAPTRLDNTREMVHNAPGQSVYDKATLEGHNVHYLNPSNLNLDYWWRNEHDYKQNNWFLLTFITGSVGLTSEGKDIVSYSVDDAFRTSEAFLKEATLTYVILEVRISLLPEKSAPLFDGIRAASKLLGRKYKVQVMSSTHYLGSKWGPNTLLTDDNLEAFFHNALNVLSNDNGSNEVSVFLFATQGMDLAIPSRNIHLGYGNNIEELSCGNGNCGVYSDGFSMPSCPKKHAALEVNFPLHGREIPTILYNGNKVHGIDAKQNFDIWFNNDKIVDSEALCVRDKRNKLVSCKTRTLKKAPILTERGNDTPLTSNHPNVLSLLIDPISRNSFHRSLPKTARLLNELGFIEFTKHTVVGGNSGPNQAALFSGVPLTNGRNGIGASMSHGKPGKEKRPQWIWDDLRDSGYITFKAEDGCVLNSNMIQSIKPHVHHGSALQNMFCFAFDRPNCLGSKMAASHLLESAKDFIDTYNDETPWAAFLSFTDSHEDSMTLIELLDNLFYNFLSEINMSNTIVMVLSDHGLHYGPWFQSKVGERERAEPILFMSLPSTHNDLHSIVAANSQRWTSPFDVHATLTDIVLHNRTISNTGSSLVRRLPGSRSGCRGIDGVPSEYCDLQTSDASTPFKCSSIPLPPNTLSFFADMHNSNHLNLSSLKTLKSEFSPSLRKPLSHHCKCATESLDWIHCKSHPWSLKGYGTKRESEMALVACEHDGEYHIDVDIRLRKARKKKLKGSDPVSLKVMADADQMIQRMILCSDAVIARLNYRAQPKTRYFVQTE